MWRVDHMTNGSLHNAEPSFHDTEDEALTEEHRLRFSGCERVVAWFCGGLVA
jgi:hypothetical protein